MFTRHASASNADIANFKRPLLLVSFPEYRKVYELKIINRTDYRGCTGGVTPIAMPSRCAAGYFHPTGRKTFALSGRCRPGFRRSCSGRFDPEQMTSPLSVERRGYRCGSGPEREDNAPPQTSIMTPIIVFVHVRGEIGLQDHRTKAVANQRAHGNLALLLVASDRNVEVSRTKGEFSINWNAKRRLARPSPRVRTRQYRTYAFVRWARQQVGDELFCDRDGDLNI
jgi:hypothetical protein